ncbi:MAG TPA: hypothetical protein V6D47_08830 [Oscillatoriaceae cyanobacterium]
MKRLLPLLMAATVLAAAPASAQDASLEQTLNAGLLAFNKGDLQGYVQDLMPRMSYNEIALERTRVLAIDRALQETFPQLSLNYRRMRVNPVSQDEATASIETEYKGSTPNYNGSGMPAVYREEGQATALYQRVDGKWLTGQMQVAWDDSYVDVGQTFGIIGFSVLPTLAEPGQPYSLRLYAGTDDNPGTAVSYAYAIVPLSMLMAPEGASRLYDHMQFRLLPVTGIDASFKAPKHPGSYVHVLVMNKFEHLGGSETLLGQKVYSRLMRVDE